jgi:hypothetical protein
MGYHNLVLEDKPVSYWRLDDEGAIASDQMSANPGTYKGSVPKIPGALRASSDLDLAASFSSNLANYIEIPDSPSLRLTEALSLEVWVNTVDPTQPQKVAEHGVLSYGIRIGEGLGVPERSRVVAIVQKEEEPAAATAFNILTANSWAYLVMTYDNLWIRLYCNAVEVAAKVLKGPLDTQFRPTYIGRSSFSTIPFNGFIDEVAVYNTVLSPSRIIAHYQASKQEPAPMRVASLVSLTAPVTVVPLADSANVTAVSTLAYLEEST